MGDKILRDLVIARVSERRSKLATVDYMRRYWGEDYHYQQIYRYLNVLYNSRKQEVLKISVEHTGLMSKKNIELLRKAGYKYIIGARIKNEVQCFILPDRE